MDRFAEGKAMCSKAEFVNRSSHRWTGHVTAGRTDTQTVMWTPDLFPTLTQIAGVANPANVTFDGEISARPCSASNRKRARSRSSGI